jgi:hypothetical protein
MGFLTIGEEYRLRVFEGKVLRRMFGPMRQEVKGRRKMNSVLIICNIKIYLKEI